MKALLPLNDTEAEQFQKHDTTIRDGAKTFVAVGKALVAMHEGKLYRAKFATFEEYAESVGMKRRNAYKLMTAVKTSLEIDVHSSAHDSDQQNQGDDSKDSGFTSVSSMAKLATYPRKKQPEIIALAKASGKVTAASIETAAATVLKTAKPEALRGVDTTKLDAPALTATQHEEAGEPAPEVADPSDPANEQPETIEPPIETPKTNPRLFELEIKALEARANESAAGNQKERDKYGAIANAMATRLSNPVKAEYNPYGR